MRRPRPVRPFRASDLLLPATALAAVVASAIVVFAAMSTRPAIDRAAASSGTSLSAWLSPVGRTR